MESHVFRWSRSRFFKIAGVRVGFSKMSESVLKKWRAGVWSQFFELEQFMGWSRNPKKIFRLHNAEKKNMVVYIFQKAHLLTHFFHSGSIFRVDDLEVEEVVFVVHSVKLEGHVHQRPGDGVGSPHSHIERVDDLPFKVEHFHGLVDLAHDVVRLGLRSDSCAKSKTFVI